MNFILTWMPFVMAFADPAVSNSAFMDKVIGWAAGFGGGIVAVFLIVSLAKNGIEFARGQGSVSIWKILGQALFLIIIVGLIFLAVNYKNLGNTASQIGNKAVNTVNTEVGTLF